MRSLGRAVAIIALLGVTAAWGQEAPNDSPTVSTGWQRVESASAIGGACYMVKNRLKTTSEAATWKVSVAAAGNYQIQIYVPPVDSLGPHTQNATYLIDRGHGALIKNGIDQTLPGWQTIGSYRLPRGSITLTLINRTEEPEGSRMVIANAARLVQSADPAAYSATLASPNPTQTAFAGDVVSFNVQLTNTGQQTWYRDPAGSGQVPVRLALTQGPAPFAAGIAAWAPGYGWLPRARDRVVMDSATVPPGQTGSFLFSIQLAENLTPGTYSYQFRPVAEPNGTPGGGVIATDITLTVNVSARPQSDLDFSALQLYRANLSAHTSDSDGDKLIDLFRPSDRSPSGALDYAATRVNVLGLTDHGEYLNPTKWQGQADATTKARTSTVAGNAAFVGLRGFKWSGTTGAHDFFGYPWEGASTDDGHLSIFGTATWTGTRAVKDGAPPQLTPLFFGPPAPATTLTGQPTTLADWLWVNGYPRPNATDNGFAPALFNDPSLFFRSNFFENYAYQPDMDRFFSLMEVGSGEVSPGYVRQELKQGANNLANQISERGGYRYLGPDTPASVANKPPDELLSLTPDMLPAGVQLADVLAALGHPEDMSKWGTNPNNQNRYWFETALRNGWHVAPSINGDNHAGCYCDESGYTGVWAKSVASMSPAQAQAAILEAIRERAVFATDDPGLSAQFSVFSNGVQYRMGQENVPLSPSMRFRLDLTSIPFNGNPADVAVQDVFLIGNDGPVRIGGNLSGPTQRIETTLPITVSSATTQRFYYMLVVSKRTGDRGENMRLLTAPIWFVPNCPQPTCLLWPTETTPPAGACTVLGFSSQNATSATLTFDGGTPIPVPTTGSRPVFPSDLNPNTALHTVTFSATGPCGTAVCALQITCGSVVQGQTGQTGQIGGAAGQCIITVSPQSGDCSTTYTATWSSLGIFSPHLLLDGADLGAVAPSGSQVLPNSGSGTHLVTLAGTSGGVPAQCQTTFTVAPSGATPSCRNSVTPSAAFLDTRIDLCFFAGNASRVDVFVDGVLKCTQLNPIPGTRYDCFVLGSEVGPGSHVASIIATGCGGTCSSGTPFRVFNQNNPGLGQTTTGTINITPTPGSSLSTTGLNFGHETVGSTSVALSFRVTNNGTAPLTIFDVSLGGNNPGDFTITAGTGFGTVPEGTSRTITIVFNPKETGNLSASVNVNSNAAASPQSVALTGIGVSATPLVPMVGLSRTSVDFGSVPVGTTVSQTVTLTNTGNAPLVVTNITMDGASVNIGDFNVGGNAITLQHHGDSEPITVTFTPSASGMRSAIVDVITNAATSPDHIMLTGTGMSAGPPEPVVSIASMVDFGNVTVGQMVTRTLTLTNTGNAPLVITNITMHASGDFLQFNVGGNSGTLMPGDSEPVSVSFMPASAGMKSAMVDIITNAPTSPDTVMLSGTGT